MQIGGVQHAAELALEQASKVYFSSFHLSELVLHNFVGADKQQTVTNKTDTRIFADRHQTRNCFVGSIQDTGPHILSAMT